MAEPLIAIVLLDGFADWEVGLFAAAGRAWLGARIRFHAPGGRPVRSMGGLAAMPDAALEDLRTGDHDALALIGSSGWEADGAPDLTDLVRGDLAAGRPVGAICGGTVAAARAGALDDRRHTSNAAAYLIEHARGYRGAAHYVDGPRAVVDGSLVTAPGTAPASFATAMLGLIFPGHPLVDEVGRLIAAEHRAA